MLRDSPHTFSERLDDALALDESAWKTKIRRSHNANSTSLVAIENGQDWVGTMGARILGSDADPELVSVYVRPASRGRDKGVADQLLDAVEAWAADRGGTLRLWVHQDNDRAHAFYQRRGYQATGRTQPHNLNPEHHELEMMRPLE